MNTLCNEMTNSHELNSASGLIQTQYFVIRSREPLSLGHPDASQWHSSLTYTCLTVHRPQIYTAFIILLCNGLHKDNDFQHLRHIEMNLHKEKAQQLIFLTYMYLLLKTYLTFD